MADTAWFGRRVKNHWLQIRVVGTHCNLGMMNCRQLWAYLKHLLTLTLHDNACLTLQVKVYKALYLYKEKVVNPLLPKQRPNPPELVVLESSITLNQAKAAKLAPWFDRQFKNHLLHSRTLWPPWSRWAADYTDLVDWLNWKLACLLNLEPWISWLTTCLMTFWLHMHPT